MNDRLVEKKTIYRNRHFGPINSWWKSFEETTIIHFPPGTIEAIIDLDKKKEFI